MRIEARGLLVQDSHIGRPFRSDRRAEALAHAATRRCDQIARDLCQITVAETEARERIGPTGGLRRQSRHDHQQRRIGQVLGRGFHCRHRSRRRRR